MKKLLLILPLAMILCFMVGCQDKETLEELEEQTSADNMPGYIFSAPAPNSDGKIKILVVCDMEGLSGQDDWRTVSFSYPEQYKKGQELLTADVNAILEGLFDGGADEIYVIVGHGSGNPEPDIILDQMDSRAKFIYQDKIPEGKSYWDYDVFDAVAVVGMHSKTGGGGFMAHTYTLGMDIIYNGRSVNETELVILKAGELDVPGIFASGDDKLKEQLQPYPWLEYVTVKYATSASTADLRPIDEVHDEMRMKARRTVKNIPNTKVVKLKTPIKASLRAVPPASLSNLEGLPGVNYHDNTVTFEAKNYGELRRGMSALIRVARTGWFLWDNQILWEILQKQEKYQKIMDDYQHNLFIRWLDYESGRWKPSEK